MSNKLKNDNEIVLSYHDSLLRKSDVKLLQGPYWINDTIIGFYFEYLEKKYSSLGSKESLFISPELTQLLKLTEASSYEILLDPIDAKSSSFIFFPLNNCDSRESAGGSHWSLLIYSHPEKTCYHFDSSKGLNAAVAKSFAKSILTFFCGKGSGNYSEMNNPQQDNGYDCGLYVLCIADLIVDHAIAQRNVKSCSLDKLKLIVNGKRKEILELIDNLRNKIS